MGHNNLVQQRSWGAYVYERQLKYLKEIDDFNFQQDVYMDGYWQSEQYFYDYKQTICKELTPPAPRDERYLTMCKMIENSSSVAVGVRFFEEMPANDKHLVGGVVPLSFYEDAAKQIADKIKNPVFFVFCTNNDFIRDNISLPGDTFYLTNANGYGNARNSSCSTSAGIILYLIALSIGGAPIYLIRPVMTGLLYFVISSQMLIAYRSDGYH